MENIKRKTCIMDTHIYDKLVLIAKEDGRSLKKQVNYVLGEYIKEKTIFNAQEISFLIDDEPYRSGR